jgi:hypothetical protein
MILRYTLDIHSQQPVYAICDSIAGECYHQTHSIFDAIQLIQNNQK